VKDTRLAKYEERKGMYVVVDHRTQFLQRLSTVTGGSGPVFHCTSLSAPRFNTRCYFLE
jgi:hypothetical protein